MSAVGQKEIFFLQIKGDMYPLQMTRSCFRNPDKIKLDSWIVLNDIAPTRRAWVLERVGGDIKIKMKVIQITKPILLPMKQRDPDSLTETPEQSIASSQESPEEKCRSLW